MCGVSAPTTPTVDPAAERQKAADDAVKKANEQLVLDARRKRGQQGLLSSADTDASFLARAMAAGGSRKRTVLGEATRKRRAASDIEGAFT